MADRNLWRDGKGAGGQRGSAMLISLMVMVILTLLGIAYILMAETENQIAVNERNASQTLYVAESGARAVVEWFNNPVGGFSVPGTADVDRTLRWVDTDSPADGVPDTLYSSAGEPMYKQTTGLIFRKPYRGGMEDALSGDEDHPDLRITAGTFLDTLNQRLFGTGAGTLADPDPEETYGKITQIDIYAPPIYDIGGALTRHGMATIKVTAQKVRSIGGTDRVLAQRIVKVVINEINYPVAGGPLQSCSSTDWGGDFTVHWGQATVQTGADLGITAGNFDNKNPTGMPYGTGSPQEFFAAEADFNTWLANNPAVTFEDPWFALLVGGTATNIDAPCPPGTTAQPCGAATTAAGFSGTTDHSNFFQNQGPLASCPDFNYALFKTVAQRGGAGIYYYAWNGSSFTEGGLGSPVTFKQATDGRSGFFFFDTRTGTPPTYIGNDCDPASCTPALSYNSADKWGSGVDSFIYLNAVSFGTTGAGIIGYTRTLNAPGEPYFDTDGDGVHDAAEPYVDLAYSTTDESATFTMPGDGVYTARGPDISVNDVAMHGIMYLSGTFNGSGNGKYYGAVVAHKVDVGATIDMWYNVDIQENAWPPDDSPVPKVYISVWETDNF